MLPDNRNNKRQHPFTVKLLYQVILVFVFRKKNGGGGINVEKRVTMRDYAYKYVTLKKSVKTCYARITRIY